MAADSLTRRFAPQSRAWGPLPLPEGEGYLIWRRFAANVPLDFGFWISDFGFSIEDLP